MGKNYWTITPSVDLDVTSVREKSLIMCHNVSTINTSLLSKDFYAHGRVDLGWRVVIMFDDKSLKINEDLKRDSLNI